MLFPETNFGSAPAPESPERERITRALQVLRQTREKFLEFQKEAEAALYQKKDADGYDAKLREKAQLILELPSRLSEIFGVTIAASLEDDTMQEISQFVEVARAALDAPTSVRLEALLLHRGSEGDYLDDMIKRLEAAL